MFLLLVPCRPRARMERAVSLKDLVRLRWWIHVPAVQAAFRVHPVSNIWSLLVSCSHFCVLLFRWVRRLGHEALLKTDADVERQDSYPFHLTRPSPLLYSGLEIPPTFDALEIDVERQRHAAPYAQPHFSKLNDSLCCNSVIPVFHSLLQISPSSGGQENIVGS